MNTENTAPSSQQPVITENDIHQAQAGWASGIVHIGEKFLAGEDYIQQAKDHLKTFYAYDLGPVLFKPTFASEHPFRTEFDHALSYFVGGVFAEDNGFAIKPWSAVRFADQHLLIEGNLAFAMGHYYFTAHGESQEKQVEFTFGYRKEENGILRICVHHSSVPAS